MVKYLPVTSKKAVMLQGDCDATVIHILMVGSKKTSVFLNTV